MRRSRIAENLEACLRRSLGAPHLRLVAMDGERPAIDEQREPWIGVKYGPAEPDDWFGVVPATARFQREAGAPEETLPLIAKVVPRRGLARTLIPWIVAQKHIALPKPYADYPAGAECDDTAGRETCVYGTLAPSTSALQAVLPRCYGTAVDTETGEHVLFIAVIEAAALRKAEADWSPGDIDQVLRAAAGWHAAFWDLKPDVARWFGPRQTTADVAASAPLFRALLEDARGRFPAIVTAEVHRRRLSFIDTIAGWHAVKDSIPSTIAHNDFNERNIALRATSPLVYDWELTQANTALRDVVSLLTFVLPPRVERAQVDAHLENHRQALIAAGVTEGIERERWRAAFACELRLEAINRIGMQFVFAAAFPLAYLERINATIEHLLDLYVSG